MPARRSSGASTLFSWRAPHKTLRRGGSRPPGGPSRLSATRGAVARARRRGRVVDLGRSLAVVAVNNDQMDLAAIDHDTVAGSGLYIDPDFFKVDSLDKSIPTWRATISAVTGALPPSSATYVRPVATGGRVTSFIRMTRPGSGNWDAALLARLPLTFPKAPPPAEVRRGKAFSVDVSNEPIIVVLESEVQVAANPIPFVIDASVGEWSRLLGDTSVNPDLSWEYWNGKGWWKLHVTLDETHNLKSKGAVRFDVAVDSAPSDWAGKTNYWIRARPIA